MLFQTLDSKKDCAGIFADGKLYFANIPVNLTKTWSYSAHLKDKNIEYAEIYCNGKSLEEVCPDYLKSDWSHINKKMKAFVSSFIESKVSLEENCFFDLTPQTFLCRYFDLKNKISEHVFQSRQKRTQE